MLAVAVALCVRADERPTEEAAPVPSQSLADFAPLWKQSLFTTVQHAIPAPTASLTDQFTLAGLYEVDGKSVAVVIDKTTSQVSEFVSNAGAESAYCLLKVEMGANPTQTRVLLQIGTQVGWLSFPDGGAVAKAGGITPAVVASKVEVAAEQTGRQAGNVGEPALSVPDIRTEPPKPVPTSEDAPVPHR
jgi:hypothetical protein